VTSISQKLSTGVPGLDNILAGGLPATCLYLIEGSPGVGKTTLAMQFLLEGTRNGETCLYLTLSETKDELQAVASSHGWDLDRIAIIEFSAAERLIGANRTSTLFHPGEMELAQLTRLLLDEVDRIRPSRVVLDSLSEMRLLAQSPLRYRREILALKQHLGSRGCTVLLLDDRSHDGTEGQVHSIVHGAITLGSAPLSYGIFRRTLHVAKLRGVNFREGGHDYVIARGGLRVFPRLVASEHHSAFGKKSAHSGNARLDALFGDGLHYGTSNLLIGPAGSGKTTIATMFAHAAAARGEKVGYYVFDETVGTMVDRAADMRTDLQPLVASGRLELNQMDPAHVSPGELAHRIKKSVEEDGTRVVVLDSLNGYVTAMPHEEFLHLHLHELLSYLNQQGVMTLMILAQHGLVGPMGTPIDVSYLADSVIITRFFEVHGAIHKAISIIKKRSGPHEATLRELRMTAGGIVVGEPLKDFQGVLTGVPSYLGGSRGGSLK
jgi:circadian clock protein KaiC